MKFFLYCFISNRYTPYRRGEHKIKWIRRSTIFYYMKFSSNACEYFNQYAKRSMKFPLRFACASRIFQRNDRHSCFMRFLNFFQPPVKTQKILQFILDKQKDIVCQKLSIFRKHTHTYTHTFTRIYMYIGRKTLVAINQTSPVYQQTRKRFFSFIVP